MSKLDSLKVIIVFSLHVQLQLPAKLDVGSGVHLHINVCVVQGQVGVHAGYLLPQSRVPVQEVGLAAVHGHHGVPGHAQINEPVVLPVAPACIGRVVLWAEECGAVQDVVPCLQTEVICGPLLVEVKRADDVVNKCLKGVSLAQVRSEEESLCSIDHVGTGIGPDAQVTFPIPHLKLPNAVYVAHTSVDGAHHTVVRGGVDLQVDTAARVGQPVLLELRVRVQSLHQAVCVVPCEGPSRLAHVQLSIGLFENKFLEVKFSNG